LGSRKRIVLADRADEFLPDRIQLALLSLPILLELLQVHDLRHSAVTVNFSARASHREQLVRLFEPA
jgi:hypothetical protein